MARLVFFALFLLVLLLSTSSASALATTDNFTWSLCSPEPPFQSGVFNVTLTPSQPVAGRTALLSIEASTDAVPAAGTPAEDFGFAAVSVSFHGLPIYSLSRPLCDVAVAGNSSTSSSSCPFTGPYTLNWEQEFPELTPAGRYHLRLRAQESQPGGREEGASRGGRRSRALSSPSVGGLTAAGPEILCVDIAFSVVRPASK